MFLNSAAKCLLVGSSTCCVVISSVQLNKSLRDVVDPGRHVLCTELPSRDSKHVGADDASHDDLHTVQPVLSNPLVVDALPPSNFGQDEGSSMARPIAHLSCSKAPSSLLNQPHGTTREPKR